ncbi:hypothetical protein NDU88_003775 [Pleurodeles waltl]|uniref:Uncharacterized protein n=1 Tax=Pleurodeles waltl TaxID=8319 RepID=A0AAV7RJ63_PLEWA|nr:hypothetical protein NDU88_003775 [Pleurodeles waltl]
MAERPPDTKKYGCLRDIIPQFSHSGLRLRGNGPVHHSSGKQRKAEPSLRVDEELMPHQRKNYQERRRKQTTEATDLCGAYW